MEQTTTRANLLYLDLMPESETPAEFTRGDREVLDHINRKVAGGGSIEEMVRFLFEQVRRITSCARIGLAFTEDAGTRITAQCAVADYEPLRLGPGYGEGLAGSSLLDILESGRVRIIRDLRRYLEEHPGSRSTRLIVDEGMRCSMTCPLQVDERVVGVMFFSSRTPDVYTEHDRALFAAIVERLSQAIEKAWRIEQLEQANRRYFEMLGFVSHEFKTPVASIVAHTGLLLEGYFGELNPEQKQRLHGIAMKSEYLLGIVRQYLDLARIESGGVEPNFVELGDFASEVIQTALEMIEPQLERRWMKLRCDFPAAPLRVRCDPNLMRIVYVNLLSNAVKYGEEGGEIVVKLWSEDGAVSSSVRNTGRGFPPEERAMLFRKFTRLPSALAGKRRGTGVGLYTTWRIVKLHGGGIDAHSEPGAWAEFLFSIPREAGTRA